MVQMWGSRVYNSMENIALALDNDVHNIALLEGEVCVKKWWSGDENTDQGNQEMKFYQEEHRVKKLGLRRH